MASWLEKIETMHLAYLFLTLVITTSVFSMVGCISEAPGIYQLFIAEIPDSNVQFGYVGICSTISDHDRVCKPALGMAPADLAKKLSLPLDVIQHVLALQGSVSLALPALSGILILLGYIAFNVAWYSTGEKSVKTRRRWIATTRIILWSAVGSAFAAAYLLTFSISAMEVIVPKSSDGLAVKHGQSLQILQWVVFSFMVLYVSTIHYMLHTVVKQARKGILPTSNVPINDTGEPATDSNSGTDEGPPTTATSQSQKPPKECDGW